MLEQGMPEVAGELLRLSKAQKMPWDGTLRRNEYQVDFPDLSLAISYDELRGYQLDLIGETGLVIDSIQAPQMGSDLGEIYKLAAAYVSEAGVAKALGYLKSA